MKALSLLRCSAACESNATSGAMVLRLREHSVLDVPVHDPATHETIRQLHQALLPATSSGLVAVSVGVDADGQLIVRLMTSSVVGFAVVSDGSHQLLLCVDPKIPQARFLELAQLAGLLPPWRTGEATLAPSTSSAITNWILAAFADALGRLFSTGGIRGTHEQVSAVLHGRVRGRIDITRLVRQFALSRPSDMPCVFPSHVYDNVWNRRLKYAVHVARQLAGLHMSESALRQRFSIYDARLAAVTLEKPKRFRRFSSRLPRSLQHYAPALMFADWIIDNCSLTGGAGSMRSVSVTLDMDKVFESAFLRGIQAIEPSARGQREWKMALRRSITSGGAHSTRLVTIRPDVSLMPAAECDAIVIDTKWKDVVSTASENLQELAGFGIGSVNNADLYQVIAYAWIVAAHLPSRAPAGSSVGCKAVLVYPCLGVTDAWSCHLSNGAASITVVVVGWDLSVPAAASLLRVRELIQNA